MHDDGEVVDQQSRPPVAFATFSIVAVNILAYIWQVSKTHSLDHPMDEMISQYFALSVDGLKHGYVWQLLTFQFLHGNIPHIFFNMMAVFMFGRVVETTMGWWRMLNLYFMAGTLGGLAQMAGTLLLPSFFPDVGVVGASAGALGLAASFAILYPNQVLYMLLVFIPLKLKSSSFLRLAVVVSAIGILCPVILQVIPQVAAQLDGALVAFGNSTHLGGLVAVIHDGEEMFLNIGHAAHLGGIITGVVLAKQFLKTHTRVPPVAKPPVVRPPEGNYAPPVLRD